MNRNEEICKHIELPRSAAAEIELEDDEAEEEFASPIVKFDLNRSIKNQLQYGIEHFIPKGAKKIVNSVDILTARLTQATHSILYKPALLFLSALGIAISVTWTNFLESCLQRYYSSESVSSLTTSVIAALWVYAIILVLVTYIPLYLIIRKRIDRVVGIAEEIAEHTNVHVQYGHVEIAKQLQIIEEGMLNKILSAVIEVMSFLAMNAIVQALQVSIPRSTGWEFYLALIFTAGVVLCIYAFKQISCRASEKQEQRHTKTQMALERLAEITTANVSMLIALLLGAGIEKFITESFPLLSGSAILIAWTSFCAAVLGAVLSLLMKINFSLQRNHSSSTISQTEEEEEENEHFHSMNARVKQVTRNLTKLQSFRDITTISHTLLSKGFVYLSAVTFNNAVMISMSAAFEASPYIPFRSVPGLDANAYAVYATFITFLGVIITVLLDWIVRKISHLKWRSKHRSVFLYNEIIEMLTFAIAYVCGKSWGEALRRALFVHWSGIWGNLAVAVLVTFMFIMLNAFLVRYFPRNARDLVQKIEQKDQDKQENVIFAI